MLDKFSEEFWDLLGLAPSKPPHELQKDPSEQEPASSLQFEETEDGDDWADYIPTSKPPQAQPKPGFEFEETPESFSFIEELEPAAPAKPAPVPAAVQPSFEFLTEEPEEKPQNFSFLEETPAWYDPSWKLPSMFQQKAEEQEPEDDLPGFEEFELLDFPGTPTVVKPEPKVTPEPKSVVAPPAVPEIKPPADLSDFNTAKSYLLSLKGTLFDGLTNAIDNVTNLLAASRQNRSQKMLANALGFIIGSIEALLRNQDSFGKNKEQIVQAANTVKEFYSEQSANLDPKFQEKVNEQIVRQVDGPKPRPLQRRSSKFHGENVIFTQNRSIDIMRNEGVTAQQAEEQAQEDWNGIVETVEKNGSKFSPGDQATFRAMFAKAMLGGDSYEDAQQYIIGLMQRDQTKKDTFYDGIDPDSESEEDIKDELKDISDEEFVSNELEGVPDEYKTTLTQQITEFAELAYNLLNIGADWEDRIKKQQEMPIELQDKIQEVYNKTIALSGKISSTPQDIKLKAYDNGNIFKVVYIATAIVNEYSETFGIEQVDQTDPIASAEAFDLGLTVQDPTKKPLTEEEKNLPQKKRIRNKEIEDKARRKYMDLVRFHGDIAGYYGQRARYSAMKEPAMRGRGEERRMETEEEFQARRDPAQEKRRIKNPDRNAIIEETNGWKDIGLSKGNPREKIKTLRQKHINTLMKMWRSVEHSWLPDSILEDFIKLRLDDRVTKLTDALNQIKSYPPRANKEVIKALEEHIQAIPKMWEETKDLVKQESVRSSRKFQPGEWARWQQEKRRGVTSSLEYFIESFFKYASMT
jgi:hypothetical protein